MKVAFDHSQSEAADITTFYFKPKHRVRYTAGQFIELSITHEQPDDRGSKRWFTLSSSPTDELLSITTKISSEKGSTFKTALQHLTPGIILEMSDPMGDFVLPKLLQIPLVFVAGGIGITPFHSIFTWLYTAHEARPIKFLYSVQTEEEIIFLPTIDKANIHATVIVQEPSAAWGGEQGSLSAELILGLVQPAINTLIYIAGPEMMVESLTKDLQKADYPKNQIVTDFFHGYSRI